MVLTCDSKLVLLGVLLKTFEFPLITVLVLLSLEILCLFTFHVLMLIFESGFSKGASDEVLSVNAVELFSAVLIEFSRELCTGLDC